MVTGTKEDQIMGKHDYENVRRLMEEVTERINRIENKNNTTKMMEEKQMETMTKVGIGTACGVAAVITLIASIAIVPVGSTGVVKRMGTVTGATMSEGVHFKMPFITSVSTMSNQIQQSSGDCNATSKDLQAISSTVTVNYHLAPEMTTYVYQNIGAAYTDTLLYPATQETVKAVMAQYSAEELITQRGAVSIAINEQLSDKVGEYGIIIDEFNLVNFSFSAEFDSAIEAKQVAEQNKIKAQTEKERRVIEAEAAAKEKTVAAEAEAEATLLKANAEAEAIKIKADAEAEANAKLNNSLTNAVLNYNAIDKWNGEYPQVVSGDNTNMLIDISGSGVSNAATTEVSNDK